MVLSAPSLLDRVGDGSITDCDALSPRDRHLDGRSDIYMPHFDIEAHFETEGCHWDRLPLSSTEATREPTFTYGMSFQEMIVLPDHPTPEMLKKLDNLKGNSSRNS